MDHICTVLLLKTSIFESMSITNKLIETVKSPKLRDVLDAMIQQRSNEDGEIRDVLSSTLPQIKTADMLDELQALNVPAAASIALKTFNQCLNVASNKPVVISAKALEDFYYLSFFDLADLDSS